MSMSNKRSSTSGPRKKLSGAQFRLLAKQKQDNIEKASKMSAKLDRFFSKVEAPGPSSIATANSAAMDNASRSQECQDPVPVDINVVDEAPERNHFNETSDRGCISESSETVGQPSVFAVDTDPARWVIDESTRDYVVKYGAPQNSDADFLNSKRTYSDGNRFLTKKLFQRVLKNNEIKHRSYLIYSKSKGCVYCGPCRLFGGESQFATDGFNDWKNGVRRLNEHENSLDHRTCVFSFMNRQASSSRIDKQMTLQMENEVQYWRDILKRVVSVTKALAIRGLSFRGSDDHFGSVHNGNFLMSMELIAEYDPILAQHISAYGNKGKGSTSYMSFQVYEEFIQLMANKTLTILTDEINSSKYFSLIVDSTPDISHVDQLSFVIRHVKKGLPFERFVGFLSNCGHKSEDLAKAVFAKVEELGLDISNCRGQSYDNAANMAGVYSGLQARIREKCSLAAYIPCSAHSLNLVGTCAAECCSEASNFFLLLQNVYSFFSASTNRWNLLNSTFRLKPLCKTRWSSREDSCFALNKNWDLILETLMNISNNPAEKPLTRSEAAGILKSLNRLESAFMSVFWGKILERLNSVSKKLQDPSMDLGIMIELFDSLIIFISDLRSKFDLFEEEAVGKSRCKEYGHDTKRKRIRTLRCDETSQDGNEVLSDGSDHFRVNTFFVIIDNLLNEFRSRKNAYDDFFKKFNFLTDLRLQNIEKSEHDAQALLKTYGDDLDEFFLNEVQHFRAYILNQEPMLEQTSFMSLSSMIHERDLVEVFPNIEIALRIIITAPIANCSAERSFSVLRRIKTYLRSTMKQDRLNFLAVLALNADLVQKIDYNELINDFAIKKCRRKPLK